MGAFTSTYLIRGDGLVVRLQDIHFVRVFAGDVILVVKLVLLAFVTRGRRCFCGAAQVVWAVVITGAI